MTQLANLSDETRDELASLALKLSGNKETRKSFLKQVQKVAPNTPIPELEVESQVEAATKPIIEELNKTRSAFEDFKLGTSLAEQKNSVMSKHGLSADDMKKMEERMGKKELPMDYEFAARLYKQETEVATPTNYGTSGYGPFSLQKNAEEFKGLLENETAWSNETAHQIIDTMRTKGHVPAF